MSDEDLSQPALVDFTTLYGAALAFDRTAAHDDVLRVSRLLALSQLIEGLVLHDRLCFEWGETPDWIPYREALQRTSLWDAISDFDLPLEPSVAQIDTSDRAIRDAADWAADAVVRMDAEPLLWAVRFRAGTYDAITGIADRRNPTIERYLHVIDQTGDVDLNAKIGAAIEDLRARNIGLLGLHVMMRVRLIVDGVVGEGEASYVPHFARQALTLHAAEHDYDVRRWTMRELSRIRAEAFRMTDPDVPPDPLAAAGVSPVFFACLARSQFPEDLIEQALILRESKPAKEYRAELRDLVERVAVDGEEAIRRYKIRVAEKMANLNNALFERDLQDHRVGEFDWLRPHNASWFLPKRRRMTPARRFPGDRAFVFLSDVLSQSLNTLRAEDKLRDVFAAPVRWDTDILSVTPTGV